MPSAQTPTWAFRHLTTLAILLPLAVSSLVACEEEPTEPPAVGGGTAAVEEIENSPAQPGPSSSAAPASASASVSATASASAGPPPRPPWEGPYFAITRSSVGIYSEPKASRRLKIGYAQRGERLPVQEELVKNGNCRKGWNQLVDGGFVCGNHGTRKVDSALVRTGTKPPVLDAILPYRYARNTTNGSPLYQSVPSKEQIAKYERDLGKKKKKPEERTDTPVAVDPLVQKLKEEARRRSEAMRKAREQMLGRAEPKKEARPTPRAPSPEAAPDAGPGKPWWDSEEDNSLKDTKLTDLTPDADDVLAQRLMKGFYLAVDRSFNWGGRRYLKTVKGNIAPAKYFHMTAGSDFKGVELDEEWQLPIAWTYGFNKARPTYLLDEDSGKMRAKGKVKKFTALNLTGKETKVGKRTYVETADGKWLQRRHIRITAPGPPPEGVGPSEVWIDVNIKAQTVVAFRGSTPFYATLISSGKEHRDKDKDHKTPLGQWRVREKHITATMDGDGTASDLPYSIQGVPYIMYFHKSWALHGAFWHRNYGIRMSHGCVNLAPLDAKYLFFKTDPPLAEGWHGAWSSEERLGSWVVVHE